jgi:hypothetical protein
VTQREGGSPEGVEGCAGEKGETFIIIIIIIVKDFKEAQVGGGEAGRRCCY